MRTHLSDSRVADRSPFIEFKRQETTSGSTIGSEPSDLSEFATRCGDKYKSTCNLGCLTPGGRPKTFYSLSARIAHNENFHPGMVLCMVVVEQSEKEPINSKRSSPVVKNVMIIDEEMDDDEDDDGSGLSSESSSSSASVILTDEHSFRHIDANVDLYSFKCMSLNDFVSDEEDNEEAVGIRMIKDV